MTIECPLCGNEITINSLKQWNFGKLTVKAYKCNKCNKSFRSYENSEGKEVYTIPKRK